MLKIFTSAALGLLIVLGAATGFCAELYEDPSTGQLYTRPGEGRTQVSMPTEKIGALYEDPDTGAVYTKPGGNRRPVAPAAPMASSADEKSSEEAGPAGYSTQAFSDAVKHVVSDEEAATFPKMKLGGEAYVGYSYDFDNESVNTDNTHRNKFSLNRGYINLKADLTPNVNARITPDITRLDGTTTVTGAPGATVTTANKGDFEFRLKYYYVAFHDFWDLYPSLKVKLGQFEGGWLDHEEGLWTYRIQGTMLVEREKFMDSANLGVDFQGKLPAGYGEWQANFVNGEGYHKDETSKYKSIQARLTINPLPGNDYTKGLELTGFYFGGKEDILHKRDRMIAFLGYKYKNALFVGGEYLWTRGKDSFVDPSLFATNPAGVNNVKGGGFSLMGWYRLPFMEPVRLMCRYDNFDHDTDSPNNTVNRYIYGVSYDLNKYVTFLVDGERTVARDYKTATTRGGGYTSSYKDENFAKVDVLVKF